MPSRQERARINERKNLMSKVAKTAKDIARLRWLQITLGPAK